MKELGVCPYMKEMQREAKRMAFIRNQKKQLKMVVDRAFENVEDPKRDYWSNRIFAHYRRRFQGNTKARWVSLLAEFNDTAAYGPIQQKKMKQYLLMARDAAAEEVRRRKRVNLFAR